MINDSEQKRIFDFEVVRRFTELEDASEQMLRDFVFWQLHENRVSTEARWNKFQRYLGAV